jgi:arylsulfatase A-like enzyme
MRILFLDLDTCRPDHLGCYGYHRPTSPNIDWIASQGVRFENCYVSDAPCLPSRSSLMTGRFGIHTGVADHSWDRADPFPEGQARGFHSRYALTSWIRQFKQAGLHCASISAFMNRHSAWWFGANFDEIIDTGHRGGETGDQVSPFVLDWLDRQGDKDDWFLHVQLWDPHTPYRTPGAFGNPFADAPLPGWLTDEVRAAHYASFGPESAQDAAEFQAICLGENPHPWSRFPRQPLTMDSMEPVRAMFDGYDVGLRFADLHIGRILEALRARGLLDDLVIVLTSDHGENLGENNVYMAHMTADPATVRVPMIVRWPGIAAPRVHQGLVYSIDVAATLPALLGVEPPAIWDSRSFAAEFRANAEWGRDYLVCSHLAGSCQRAVRFEQYHFVRTYHDGYRPFPDVQLYDLSCDYHQTRDLADERPDLVGRAEHYLADWHADAMRRATHPADPLWVVVHNGGAEHVRGFLEGYCRHLRATGRESGAAYLESRHARRW